MPPRTAYLDWNATAPLRPEAAAATAEALARCGNPSSVHRFGREARRALEAARGQVAALVGAAPAEVVLTSGGTEANQLALRGLPGRRVMVSAIEHDSVRQAVPDAAVVPVAPRGIVDLHALDRMLAAEPRPALVSLMLANNETGIIQPVAEAAQIAHARGALLHCDAVQGAGKLPLDRARLGADLMTLSAHKLGGPPGVGALVVAGDLPLMPLHTVVYGGDAARLPNTLCIAMPGVAAATQVMALDLAGVMVSAGAACSSGKVRRSHVLDAMGVPAAEAECAIRISLGWSTAAADIDHLVEAWGALYARTRASAA